MRVFFINRFYWPDEPATAQLLRDLAEELSARDHAISVIAGPSRTQGPKTEIHAGVQIHRVGASAPKGSSLSRRLFVFLRFYAAAFRLGLKKISPGDVVVVMTDPPLLNLPIHFLCLIKKAKLVHWVQDIYPEIAMRCLRSRMLELALTPLQFLRNRAWKGAHACVAISQSMGTYLRSQGVTKKRLHVIENWAPLGIQAAPDELVARERQTLGLGGKFILGYSGNLGRVHLYVPILELMRALAPESRILFLISGNGDGMQALRAAVESEGLKNVLFQSSSPREKLSLSLSLADMHLITLRPDCHDLVFPSKYYGINTVRRPLLYFGPKDGELAGLIALQGIGGCFAPDESTQAAHFVKDLANDSVKRAKLRVAVERIGGNPTGFEQASEAWDLLLQNAYNPPASDKAP